MEMYPVCLLPQVMCQTFLAILYGSLVMLQQSYMQFFFQNMPCCDYVQCVWAWCFLKYIIEGEHSSKGMMQVRDPGYSYSYTMYTANG